MTGKRYFYTDALAAAWMAKHFGMWFSFINGINANGRIGLPALESHISHGHLQLEKGRFYVHPDSLHLLEPQKGDKVSYSWGYGEHRSEGWDEVKAIISAGDEGYAVTGNGERCVLMDSGDYPYISRITRIFERNGLPYMWPDSEAA